MGCCKMALFPTEHSVDDPEEGGVGPHLALNLFAQGRVIQEPTDLVRITTVVALFVDLLWAPNLTEFVGPLQQYLCQRLFQIEGHFFSF